jgi:hypothetical protein
MPAELCRHCGRDTSAGSALFSGRVRIVGEPDEFVCPTCLDQHPIRDANGVVLSKERLAALSYVMHPRGPAG